MQDDQSPKLDSTEQTSTTEISQPQPAPASNNRKLIMVIGAVIGILVLVLIGLVAMLLTKNDDGSNVANTEQAEQRNAETENNEQTEAESGREVLKRVATSDPKLEYVIYKPQQNAANTTIYFAVENVCEGCQDATSMHSVASGFDHKTGSFLVDDNNGKKYSVIKDEDDEVLATTSCFGYIEFGQKQECFVAFTKVPSGSTVSWVFGKNRIDNIKVD